MTEDQLEDQIPDQSRGTDQDRSQSYDNTNEQPQNENSGNINPETMEIGDLPDDPLEQAKLMGMPAGIESLIGVGGISAADVRKLRAANYYNIRMVALTPLRTLSAVKGLSAAKAEAILKVAHGYADMGFTTAALAQESREQLIAITTGSPNLDNLLGGGVETGSITELYGEFRTGKSQLCHTIAVTAQLPVDIGGGEGRVLFVDTEGTFRAQRIVEIARRFGMDPDHALNNIAYARAYHSDHQLKLLEEAEQMMSSSRFSLLIVDSIINHYRSEFTGRGELANRQQHLSHFLRRLQSLADVYGIAVVITNQVTASPDAMYGDAKKAVGGHVLAHASTTRLYFKKGKGEERLCKIIDSPWLPEKEEKFGIYADGINDCKQVEKEAAADDD